MESTERDSELWRIARKRVEFRNHLAMYVLVISMLWLIWFFSENKHDALSAWPVWPMIGWGIGLAFNYYGAYISSGRGAVQREYDRMARKNETVK